MLESGTGGRPLKTQISTSGCSGRRYSPAFRIGIFVASGAFSCCAARSTTAEFVTIMRFDSLDAVREFAGEDYEVAVVPEKARAVLSCFDGLSQHCEVRVERSEEGKQS